jgi:HD-GYP domain-containing protein (c-di-GMP phosphodiesterase class II)
MRLLPVEELKPGMKVARNIFGNDLCLLLSAGVTLTPALITRLKELEFNGIYIQDDIVGQIEVQEFLSEKLKAESISVVRQAFEKAKLGSRIDIRQVASIINSILDEVLSFSNLLISIVDMRNKNSYHLSHSVSVCTLSLLTGIALGYDQLKLFQLGLGAFLHDLGKSRIDPALMIKQPPYTSKEAAIIQSHCTEGFEILRRIPELNILSAHIAFQHHERFDGTGYPRGIKGNEIHPFAAIVAVANAYDLLVSPPQGTGLFPAKALEMILVERGRTFDPEIALAFAQQISPYPTGCNVRLSTGEIAIVLSTQKNYPTRPIVKLITDQHGKVRTESFPEIDLSQHKDIKITEVHT